MSSSVFLPKTDFPMRGQLPVREPEIVKSWEGLYQKIRKKSEGQEKFVVAFGPPYANGKIHLGHVLTEVLKDILNKTYQMRGYDAPMVPGWDAHGLPIEWKVEEEYKEKGINRRDVPFEEFTRSCREFANKWIAEQKQAFQRLGILADWENYYCTMFPESEARIIEEFYRWIEAGFIYRGLKPVLWSVVEQTALAEAEVEYKDKESTAIHVMFPLLKVTRPELEGVKAVIWTTTPWTLPANRAIAYGPDIDYVVINTGSNRLLVAKSLAEGFGGSIEHNLKGSELEGCLAAHPLKQHGYKDVPLLPGDHVTEDAGTGLVHTAPSHGLEDFALGKQHNLEVPEIVGPDGLYTDEVPLFGGQHIFKADVVSALEECGNLLRQEKYMHSYPHSWRSKAPLIYRTTSQWFASMDKVRDKAMNALKNVQFTPAVSRHRMEAMLSDRPDWCLSRQRWWGVPLAMFMHKKTHEILFDAEVNARILNKVKVEGIEAWRLTPSAEFLSTQYNEDDYEKVLDVLDVWFDSACTQSFVLRDRSLPVPADVYLEGSDQHRGWFQTSLLHGCAVYDEAPYKRLITHGFVLNDSGDKMSKSGKSLSPDELLNTHGADILRLWVANSQSEEDVRLSKDILGQQNDIYRRYRNTLRYLMGALSGWDAKCVEHKDMPLLESFILHRLFELNKLHKSCETPSDLTRFYYELHHFCTNDLSSLFFDVRKDSLYCDSTKATKRQAVLTVMHHVWHCLVRWLAPVISFTAEEAWGAYVGEDSIHEQTFWDVCDGWNNPTIAERIKRMRVVRRHITTAIEKARESKQIGSSLQACIKVAWSKEDSDDWAGEDLAEWAIVSSAQASVANSFSVEVSTADGSKCERCWKVLPEVAKSQESLCERCEAV